MVHKLALVVLLLSAAAFAGAAPPGSDLARTFADPPPGYGMVPLYWWSGEPISVERIAWQLDRLKEMGFTGVQANFVPFLDGPFQERSSPQPFTDAWWKIWEAAVRECKARDMKLGIDDYGFHEMIWDLKGHPELQGRRLGHVTSNVDAGEKATLHAPAGAAALCARAYRTEGGRIAATGAVDLSARVRDGTLEWGAPDGAWRVVMIFAVPGGVDMASPAAGRQWIGNWFAKFEEHSPGEMGKTISYFFQDEFYFPGMPIWSDRLPDAFRKAKGYDLVAELPALFEDIGPRTPKVRLDYYDVAVGLLEEGYFRPVYDWCQARGVIYGHDNLRGDLVNAVQSYGDYFRPQSWFQAPGSDRMPDLIIGKTCASIAQLYGRPRAWLEAYYGTGWGVSPENLFIWDNQSLMDGYNLLSYHSLYHSTRAGWWTWAPGDPHFRQPYWSLMDGHYAYLRRLCWLLSQGTHRCDAAIVLPVSTIQAGLDGSRAQGDAHGVAQQLFARGIDFDFIDDPALARAEVEDGRLAVSGGAYRVLVLPSLPVIRFATLEKALALFRSGGMVIAVGALPDASDRVGSGDPRVAEAVAEIFGEVPSRLREIIQRALRERTGFSPKASWIWTPEDQGSLSTAPQFFRKSFTIPGDIASARVRITCDNIYTLFMNGKRVAHDETWESIEQHDVTSLLRSGANAIAVEARTTDPGWGALAAEVKVTLKDGKEIEVATDETWVCMEKSTAGWADAGADDSGWKPARRVASIGEGVWGDRIRLVGAADDRPAVEPLLHRGPKGAVGAFFARPDDPGLTAAIDASIPRDFSSTPPIHVLHRLVEGRDVYAVCNPGPGAITALARFRSEGEPMLWDPWTGRIGEALVALADGDGTSLRLSFDPYELKLVVFSRGAKAPLAITSTDVDEVTALSSGPAGGAAQVSGFCRSGGKKTAAVIAGGKAVRLEGEAAKPPPPIVLDGSWEFELKPTLDNRWGDFRSPPSEGVLGPDARRFRWAEEPPGGVGSDWAAPDLDDSRWAEVTASFGPRFWALGPIDPAADTGAIEAKLASAEGIDTSAAVRIGGKDVVWKRCDASLRWGIERDPIYSGAYGTAANALGLKGRVPDALLDLTSGHPGATWLVWTSLRAAEAKETRLGIASPAAWRAWLNGSRILEQAAPVPHPTTYHLASRTSAVRLKAGANPLLIRFIEPAASRNLQLRAAVAVDPDARDETIAEIDDTKAPSGLLARRAYGRSRDADLDPDPGRSTAGWYRFRAPPGLKAMRIVAHGTPGAWIDGREMGVEQLAGAPSVAREREGARAWRAVAKEPAARSAVVAIRIEPRPGFQGGAAIAEPVEFECGPGEAPLGSWADIGLATYSGQAVYRRTVTLPAAAAVGHLVLDLGKLAAAVRVQVDGTPAGTRIAPPWRIDLGRIEPGRHTIEILIANTLANHMQVGVPDGHVFEGQTAAGLLGPVRLEAWPAVTLRPAEEK